MSCPKTFFDFNDGYFRISEVTAISCGSGKLVVKLRDGTKVEHRDYNGSSRKMEDRLLAAIKAVEG